MAVYSTNQVRNLYVVNAIGDPTADSAAVGTMQLKKTDRGEVYGLYKGAGGLTRTDLIGVNTIRMAKASSYDSLKRPLQKWEVSLDPSINGGAPIAGQEYLLRVIIREYGSMSPESYLTKYGMVQITTGMAATDFYKKMLASLKDSFRAYDIQYFKFSLDSDSAPTKIVIEENAQPWALGTKSSDPIYAQIVADSVTTEDKEYVQWGITKTAAPTSFVSNGHTIADLEYFTMKERGDTYGNVGYPYVIYTQYLVDPSKEYNILDTAFYYEDEGTFCQKSEKQMSFVFVAEGDTPAAKIALANSFIDAFNTVAGSAIVTKLVAPSTLMMKSRSDGKTDKTDKALEKDDPATEVLPASKDV